MGRPNAGKSTLVNALVESKVSIVTPVPQTTRNRILGILHRPDAQVIFMDTPGVHKPLSRLNEQMMNYVRQALADRDLAVLIVDASEKYGKGDEFVINLLNEYSPRAILALNKVDRVHKPDLLPLMERYSKLYGFEEIIPISALHSDGLDVLLNAIIERLPEGPQYFPADEYTDQPERFLAAEIIREKVIRHTKHEMPYVTAVLIDAFEEGPTMTRHPRHDRGGKGLAEAHCDWGRCGAPEGNRHRGAGGVGEAFPAQGLSGTLRESPAALARQQRRHCRTWTIAAKATQKSNRRSIGWRFARIIDAPDRYRPPQRGVLEPRRHVKLLAIVAAELISLRDFLRAAQLCFGNEAVAFPIALGRDLLSIHVLVVVLLAVGIESFRLDRSQLLTTIWSECCSMCKYLGFSASRSHSSLVTSGPRVPCRVPPRPSASHSTHPSHAPATHAADGGISAADSVTDSAPGYPGSPPSDWRLRRAASSHTRSLLICAS